MVSSLIPVPPRQVTIGEAASFVGTTPQEIQRYHEIGLLPGLEPGSDDRRRFGYDEMIRLLWIRTMVDAGIVEDRIRDAFAGTAPGAADGEREGAGLVGLGLLSDLVTSRLEGLPEGFLRQDDLDILLVTERIFSPLGAAVQAGRFIALATRPDLRAESDRIDAAEQALDDTIAVDDPRVAQVAAERHAFELTLNAVIDESGQTQDDDALFDAWDAAHPETADDGEAGPLCGTGEGSMSVGEAVSLMPYDWSPARRRCMELVVELGAP